MDSVLNTIKKMLGIDAEYTAFDTDITVLINSELMTLQQLGVVDKAGAKIADAGTTWQDVLGNEKNLESAKEYLYLKVKPIFDPPTSSFVNEAYEKRAEELQWRLKEQMESYPGDLPRPEPEGDGDAV